jgi:hypothetical protein
VATVEQLKDRATPLLPPASEVRQAFICQTYRCVAVTQDAIFVLDAPRLSGGANPRSIAARLPRHTQLGPVQGRWGQFTLLDRTHWIKRRFQDQIAAADAEAGF